MIGAPSWGAESNGGSQSLADFLGYDSLAEYDPAQSQSVRAVGSERPGDALAAGTLVEDTRREQVGRT